MIRVFLIALVALAALVVASRYLPGGASAPAGSEERVAQDGSSPFSAWDGAWEGTFRTYHSDGTLASSTHVRQEYTTISPAEQNVTITDRHSDGRVEESRGKNLMMNGRLECRVWAADGTVKTLTGRRMGPALFWHRRDDAAGIEETFREEIIRSDGGDLYTIDGYSLYGGNRDRVMVLEGRYRRAQRAEE